MSCRGCGGSDLRIFLDLGDLPLADALVVPERLNEPEERFPLRVAFCSACALVQITEDVDPRKLFVDNYHYFSSFSDQLLDHSHQHALGLIESQKLGTSSFVVEIASNDGYLLKSFVERGIPVLGFDPAPEQARHAIEIGVPTQVEFFTQEVARRTKATYGPADVILANNVMAHIPDLNDFVAGMSDLVSAAGVITIENPSVAELIRRCAFDTIYHEHYFYHSCLSVDTLMRRHGLYLNDVERFPDLHGGTNRWIVQRFERPTERLQAALLEERSSGLGSFEYYADFGQRVDRLRADLMSIIEGLRSEGKTIAAYGAAAKGATMLNVMGITREMVPYVIDRNHHKHGRHMPGTNQPIVGPEVLYSDPPDVVLLLAWNFAAEIMAQQRGFADAGGRFLIPVPEPELV